MRSAHPGRSGTTKVKRSRPMLLRQSKRFVAEFADLLGGEKVGHMHDQRVEAWPSLRLVNARDRFGVACVRG